MTSNARHFVAPSRDMEIGCFGAMVVSLLNYSVVAPLQLTGGTAPTWSVMRR